MIYGVAAYTIVRNTEDEAKAEVARITDVKQSAAGYKNYQQWLAGTQLEQRVSLEDYSVSNRGLRSRAGRHAAAGHSTASPSSRPPASICCCSSAARNWKRWSGSRTR